ncbi:hypothetical protein [Maricaulis sp.]|uniref:hypothetical protein n=1 Tax=Maricaulis sp. TaxID=1486257 RepID=UPI002627D1C1|nr:hypothetical protein [Maricaulis sp.]
MGARPRLAAVLAASAFIVFSGPVSAQSFRSGPVETAQPAFEPQLSGGRVAFATMPGLSNYTLRVTGPGNYSAERFSERRAPSLRLADFGALEDGLYHWSISAATSEVERRVGAEELARNGRSGTSANLYVGRQMSGSFQVRNGQIVQFDPNATEN